MEPIGPRITAAREALGYTQAQLAERVPCNPQTVSNWETGRRQPRYGDLLRLAEVLGRPVSWFLGEEGGRSAWEPVQAAFERVTRELEEVSRLLGERAEPAPSTAADVLAPIAGRIAAGPLSEVIREPAGWRVFAAGQVEGVTILRVDGDAHHPLLRNGDLVGVAATDTAEPGDLVIAVLEDGTEVLKRLAADGSLESVNPVYAPLHPAARLTGVVRWQHRDLGEAGDGVAQASERLRWVERAEREVAEIEQRLERGVGDWSELRDLCDRIVAAAEGLRPVYGSSVLPPAARALGRIARSLGEQGQYAEALEAARRAEDYYSALERVGERSRDALNNLYNASQLELFLGDLDEAEELARTAAECDDWTVRWKSLKNLAEIRVNFRGVSGGDDGCDEILALAAEHYDEDPQEALLARAVAYEIRGNAAFTRGNLPAAREAAERQREAAEEAGLPYRLANALLDYAQYALAAGDVAGATTALTRAAPLTTGQDLGDLEAMRLAHLAVAETLDGSPARARVTMHAAMRRAAEIGSPRAALMAELAGLAIANAADDLLAREDHAAAARGIARRMGMAPYERVIDRALKGSNE